MLVELVMNVVWGMVKFLIATLGGMLHIVAPTFDLTPLLNLMSYGVYIFGPTAFCFVVNTVVGWASVHLGWAIIEWIYKKIPGVD